MNLGSFCLVIPTYRRETHLSSLLNDVIQQDVIPQSIVVVDGDSSSGNLLKLLGLKEFPPGINVIYVPSNHANLPYQRYLGWKAAQGLKPDVLIFLDDDLAIRQSDVLRKLVSPFFSDVYKTVVGVTAPTWPMDYEKAPQMKGEGPSSLGSLRHDLFLVRVFGAARNTAPGELSISGDRKLPLYNGNSYTKVSWLSGRVMAYQMKALRESCFSEDLFAMYECNCGKGEDTVLSRRVGLQGDFLFAFHVQIDHANDIAPNAYPMGKFQRDYAVAYSRRMILENYHVGKKITPVEYFHFLKSYGGNVLIRWWQGLTQGRVEIANAWGYTCGAIAGILVRPSAHRLTPRINWSKDSEEAILQQVVLQ